MKKLFGLLFSVLIIYSIYFDLTVGTLPYAKSEKAEATVISDSSLSYFEATVKSGETLITIEEHYLNKSLPVSIAELVHDFKNLNPGKTPEKLQVGKTYRFPKYQN